MQNTINILSTNQNVVGFPGWLIVSVSLVNVADTGLHAKNCKCFDMSGKLDQQYHTNRNRRHAMWGSCWEHCTILYFTVIR